MVTRRSFLQNAALGGGLGGLAALNGCRATPVNRQGPFETPRSPEARRLYDKILTYPVDDTHCHSVTERDAHTTVQDFLLRISLVGFSPSGYFPPGVYEQWLAGDPDTRARLDKEHGISKVAADIARHFGESVFVKFMVKEMASFLGCRPNLAEVIEARNARGKDYPKYIHDLFQDVKLENVMIDTGFIEGDKAGLDRFEQTIQPTQMRCIARLETIQEQLFRQDISFQELVDRFMAWVKDALDGTGNYGRRSYGMKSYILPGIGLIRPCYEPSVAERSWEDLKRKRNVQEPDREVLANRGKELQEYLLTLALEECLNRDMPMQFHTGDGEAPYVILRNQHPYLLEEIVRFDKNGLMRMPKIIPVHAGYPLVDEAMWLSHLYNNCYFEISIMNPFAHQGLYHRYLQAMEAVPFSKILFASDTFNLPEIFWLAGRWGKRFLAQALAVYVQENMLTEDEALEGAQMILFKNNRELYHLS